MSSGGLQAAESPASRDHVHRALSEEERDFGLTATQINGTYLQGAGQRQHECPHHGGSLRGDHELGQGGRAR